MLNGVFTNEINIACFMWCVVISKHLSNFAIFDGTTNLCNTYVVKFVNVIIGAYNTNILVSNVNVTFLLEFKSYLEYLIIPLRNGGGMRLTISKYYLPSGNSISEVGVTPDILVEETSDNFEINSKNDNQLNYALDLLTS